MRDLIHTISTWIAVNRFKAVGGAVASIIIMPIVTKTVEIYYEEFLQRLKASQSKQPQIKSQTQAKAQPKMSKCEKDLIENRARTSESQRSRDKCRTDYKDRDAFWGNEKRANSYCVEFEKSLAVSVALGNDIEARCRDVKSR